MSKKYPKMTCTSIKSRLLILLSLGLTPFLCYSSYHQKEVQKNELLLGNDNLRAQRELRNGKVDIEALLESFAKEHPEALQNPDALINSTDAPSPPILAETPSPTLNQTLSQTSAPVPAISNPPTTLAPSTLTPQVSSSSAPQTLVPSPLSIVTASQPPLATAAPMTALPASITNSPVLSPITTAPITALPASTSPPLLPSATAAPSTALPASITSTPVLSPITAAPISGTSPPVYVFP